MKKADVEYGQLGPLRPFYIYNERAGESLWGDDNTTTKIWLMGILASRKVHNLMERHVVLVLVLVLGVVLVESPHQIVPPEDQYFGC